jgi:hypothetical protein
MAESRPKRAIKQTKKWDITEEEKTATPKPNRQRKRVKKEPFEFEQLPRALRLRIVGFMNAGLLCSSASVSKEFKTLAEDNGIWAKCILSRFGHLFEEDDSVQSDEDIIANWPAKKAFKEVYRGLYDLENAKQEHWAKWGSAVGPSTQLVDAKISGTCPLCENSLVIQKNDAAKKEDAKMDEDDVPPSEFIVQCKTPKCGFVLPYSACNACNQPCNMMNTLICTGENCSSVPVSKRIHCWDCAKECEGKEKDKCLGTLCVKCILTATTKRGTANACPVCSFRCGSCGKRFFVDPEKNVCKKCKLMTCSKCASMKCKCGYRAPGDEDDDEEFGEDDPSEEEEDDYDDGDSDD